ncbi:hypothetical protein [Polaromonas sp. AET17H-212]|uniref:hypothetical protein n=1 Tax=Polaromonas sp. AET17H-212 TaxID=1977061 RepID=UPI003F8E4F19
MELKQVFGWLSIGTAISGFIGPFAAGLLIDHAGATAGSTTGYRAAFLLMAIFPLLCWLLLRSMTVLPLTGVPKVSKNSITPASLAPCTKPRALLVLSPCENLRQPLHWQDGQGELHLMDGQASFQLHAAIARSES